mmetsp:Transcript_10981/g.17404  ORF Transcript_10981/g.17404 Transcript_10981/m.17404 type:complete len:299 (-) Transcript_10981:180-1076(-)
MHMMFGRRVVGGGLSRVVRGGRVSGLGSWRGSGSRGGRFGGLGSWRGSGSRGVNGWGVGAAAGLAVAVGLSGVWVEPALNEHCASNTRVLTEEDSFRGIVALLLGRIRDKDTAHTEFVMYTDRLMRILIETTLGQLTVKKSKGTSPTGGEIDTYSFSPNVAAISILRSGDALMGGFSQVMPGCPTGSLLLVKHEKKDKILYSKLPKGLKSYQVLLMDPMLATGSTMISALKVLTKEQGVDPSQITVVTLVSSKGAIENVHKSFPQVRIITAVVDKGLDKEQFINPGLGSFGDRYFGTN